ncbi:MAG: hypothetical protein ACRETM_13975 [Stenotrophobium sp.]
MMIIANSFPQNLRRRRATYGEKSACPPSALAPIVITDIRWHNRKIPLSYSGHVRGWHPFRSEHGSIGFESLVERNLLTALASCREIENVVSQPVTIFYRIENKQFRYTPDYMVTVSEVCGGLEVLGFRGVTFVECKPDELVREERDCIDRNFRAVQMAFGQPAVLITQWDLTTGVLRPSHGY